MTTTAEPISAALWLPLLRDALAQEGRFRFPLRGTSMRPTLPVECEIEIAPLPARTPLGSLIVFVARDTLVAHRLVRRAGTAWIAQGDGRIGADAPIRPEQVLGVVLAAHAAGQPCWPSRLARPLAWYWIARHHALRVLRAGWRMLAALLRRRRSTQTRP